MSEEEADSSEAADVKAPPTLSYARHTPIRHVQGVTNPGRLILGFFGGEWVSMLCTASWLDSIWARGASAMFRTVWHACFFALIPTVPFAILLMRRVFPSHIVPRRKTANWAILAGAAHPLIVLVVTWLLAQMETSIGLGSIFAGIGIVWLAYPAVVAILLRNPTIKNPRA